VSSRSEGKERNGKIREFFVGTGKVDYDGLDMLNVRMVLIRSNAV